ncbi:uncharacterized protein LOC113375823 [Ctenocephalides felis]|uniref:uncharacterized protein LOC113375823 n=1 Tax=Ctenocephalides felis TaxID=7515 RepID=UPI000E6E57C4|nr:uncharacterized protein LOC113375823 [Ctenocephalides felis]
MCHQKDNFENLNRSNAELKLANNNCTVVKGIGSVQTTFEQKENKHVRLENVLYVPDLRNNLLSVFKATDNGYTVIFTRKSALLTKEGKIELKAHRRGDLYYINQKVNSATCKQRFWAEAVCNANYTKTDVQQAH